MIEENDVISNVKQVCGLFNEYFCTIAKHIGFNHEIPSDFSDDNNLVSLIETYDRHPSIIAIKNNITLDIDDFKLPPVTVDCVLRLL